MRTSEVFILGTVAGAVVTWLWGREIQGSLRGKTRELRAKAAEGLRAGEAAIRAAAATVKD
jgi:paraquat-inducible protein B